MKSPKQWLHLCLHGFVVRIVGETVKPSDLIHLRSFFRTELTNLSERLDAQNKELEILRSHVENQLNGAHDELRAINSMLSELVSRHDNLENQVKIQASRIRAKPHTTSDIQIPSSRDARPTIGYAANRGGQYVEFIESFRPTFEQLLGNLRYVTSWLPKTGRAVDLGAGRGEMVKLLSEFGLEAYGIDSNLSVVADAKRRGIEVVHQEIDDFLAFTQASSFDVITAVQVIEHVESTDLEEWFRQIFKSLKPNGVFIAETPNPHAIDAFKAFWIDITHKRLYYPESLLHMAQTAGFSKAEIWVEGAQESIDERLGYAGSYTLIATV
jgi:2-polyprenyl-3-methyl-5-hydroxy-6-metoxy-1,4-benzoquinol methylase